MRSFMYRYNDKEKRVMNVTFGTGYGMILCLHSIDGLNGVYCLIIVSFSYEKRETNCVESRKPL